MTLTATKSAFSNPVRREGGAPASALSSGGLAFDRTRSSPNHGIRAAAFDKPEMLILHYTEMLDGPTAVDWLCNPASQVSCHYVVAEDGALRQLVDDDRRAWHAGRSSWADLTDINSASIGIEIVNGGHRYGLPPFPDAQIEAVIALCRHLTERYDIRPKRILAHSDVAPARKRDPGERFPWQRLAAAGVAQWVEPAPDAVGFVLQPGDAGADVEDLQEALARYGYGVELTGVYDALTKAVVRAFQRRFRPARIDGLTDPATRETLRRLNAETAAI